MRGQYRESVLRSTASDKFDLARRRIFVISRQKTWRGRQQVPSDLCRNSMLANPARSAADCEQSLIDNDQADFEGHVCRVLVTANARKGGIGHDCATLRRELLRERVIWLSLCNSAYMLTALTKSVRTVKYAIPSGAGRADTRRPATARHIR